MLHRKICPWETEVIDAIPFPTKSSIKLTSELCSYTKPILIKRSIINKENLYY